MKLLIDIPQKTYDAIMARDWKNAGWLFSEELQAIHDGKVIEDEQKQEPCEDAISRQAVDDAIYDYSRACDVDYAQIMEYIDKLPSVNPQEPKTGWIPVSEMLPEKDRYTDFYKSLVAVSCTSHDNICDSVTAYFDGKHFYRHKYDRMIMSGVKAWMPLPESYKAESEDKE